jgi:hypothetical protein
LLPSLERDVNVDEPQNIGISANTREKASLVENTRHCGCCHNPLQSDITSRKIGRSGVIEGNSFEDLTEGACFRKTETT